LLEAGVEPFVTLNHWDLPQALQDRGGWANRDTVYAFIEYADVASRRLGDRVHRWITHNEPWVVAMLGHLTGDMPPAIRDIGTALQVTHHLLLSHGRVVPILRSNGDEQTRVGITLNLHPVEPASDRPGDLAAARRLDGHHNRLFLDPLFRGQYPEDMFGWYGREPEMAAEDLQQIARPIDFLGVNYYFRHVVQDAPGEGLHHLRTLQPKGEYTEMGWEVYPQGLYDLLLRLHRDYNVANMYITENGAAYADEVTADGKIHDERRINYLREHFNQAHRAIQEGVGLRGYFVWSLMDNFEWARGFSMRFGLTYVNYATQERIIKESGFWYRQVIADNGITVSPS